MDEVMIGRVIKPHGVRGELAVEPTTDVPGERFAPGTRLLGRQAGREVTHVVTAARPHQGRLLLRLEGVTDRSAADTLRGMSFHAPRRTHRDDDEYYDDELVGMAVHHDGERIGEVADVRRLPGRRLLVLRHDTAGEGGETAGDPRESLIPIVPEIVPGIDTRAHRIDITPPEGLLDL